jgi:hypothetical protein
MVPIDILNTNFVISIFYAVTNDTFYYNAEINGQKCMNRVQNTQNSKIESNRNVFSIGRQSSEADSNTINKPEMKTNRLTEIKNKEHELKSQHQPENAFVKKRGYVEFKPQKINSKNI